MIQIYQFCRDDDALIDIWHQIMGKDKRSWVLFASGTCVILSQPERDLIQQATDLLKEWGPIKIGTTSEEFGIIELAEIPGWIVTCHHPDIVTYVAPEEMLDQMGTRFYDVIDVGRYGRIKRDGEVRDWQLFGPDVIIHVENKQQYNL